VTKSRKTLLEDLPALSESETSSGPLLSAVVKRLTSKLPTLPAPNPNDKFPKYLTKSDDFLPKTDTLSGVLNGNVFVHGKTLGGLKEDFTRAEVPDSDSVRRALDFDKTSISTVGADVNKRPTTGTSETSTVTNVER